MPTVGFLSSIGGSGEPLNPFRAIDPALAIPLGIVLVCVYPSLLFLRIFRTMNKQSDGDEPKEISSRMKAIFVISLIGTMFGGYREFPAMRSLLALVAVLITILLPMLVGILTIRQIVEGSL